MIFVLTMIIFLGRMRVCCPTVHNKTKRESISRLQSLMFVRYKVNNLSYVQASNAAYRKVHIKYHIIHVKNFLLNVAPS